MALLTITAGFPYIGGLDRDISEQVFSFVAPDGPDQEAAVSAVLDLMQDFYNATAAGQTNSISHYYADFIDRSACFLRGAFKDAATGVQEGPTFQVPLTMDAAATGVSLPAEVACCLSFANDADSGAIRRRRGRVYLGPFVAGAVVAGDTNDYSRPATSFITDVVAAAVALMDGSLTADVPWGVWSRADGVVRAVGRGWVDNEWDTQRRRGADPTTKQTFVVGPP